MTRRRRAAWLAVLACASLVASLAGAELLLRRLVPQWSVFYPPINFRPDLFEAASFGYRLKPGVVGTYRYSWTRGQPTAIHGNRDGFRDARDFDPDADAAATRVVVLGDSMAFGIGVEEDERFTELIEDARPGVRLYNLGMVGFGTDLMLRAFESVGRGLRPHVVVLVVHSDDLRRAGPAYTGMGFALPKFVLQGGALVSVPYPEPSAVDRSLLVQGARYALARYSSAPFALHRAILDRVAELASQDGFALVLAYVPPPRAAWHDRMRRDFLAGWAAERRVAFVDLTPRAGEAARAYLEDDPHWSVAGHAMVAQRLAPALDDARSVTVDPEPRAAAGEP